MGDNFTERRRAALRSFSQILARQASLGRCYVKLPESFDLRGVPENSFPNSNAWTIHLRRLLGQTNAVFRLDRPGVKVYPRGLQKQVIAGPEANHPDRTDEYEYALNSYVGYMDNENTFVPESTYAHAGPHPYGVPGNGWEDAEVTVAQIVNSEMLDSSIFTCLKTYSVHFDHSFNVDDICHHISEFVSGGVHNRNVAISRDARNGLFQRIETRYIHLNEAHSAFARLKARVELLIRQRAEMNEHFLEECSDDTLASLALHLHPSAAGRLLQTCKRFASVKELTERKPHFRFREVVGSFPHRQTVSRDRADVKNGIDKPVIRNFVLADKPIRIYIDYACLERRTIPLKKKERKDGLSNQERDLEDDEYEIPPEHAERYCPGADSTLQIVPPYADIVSKATARRRAEWRLLEGPYEKVHMDHFFRRMDFPVAGITMRCYLVFADTLGRVPCDIYEGALVPSAKLRLSGGTFSEGYMSASDLLPASCKVHVPTAHLSTSHGGRLFKLCVVISGSNNYQLLYSAPFEVVSTQAVVDNAKKRVPPAARREAKKARRAAKNPAASAASAASVASAQ